MPFVAWASVAGGVASGVGKALWGPQSCWFFGAAWGGLVCMFPVKVFSSPSGCLPTEITAMLQRGLITCPKQRNAMVFVIRRFCPQHPRHQMAKQRTSSRGLSLPEPCQHPDPPHRLHKLPSSTKWPKMIFPRDAFE